MKKILLTSIIVITACLSTTAKGKIVTDSLQSTILGAQVKYNVYLPDGFGKENCLYPVVYLLHGLGDNYRAWADKARLREVADELISSGEADKMVIIMPNGGDYDKHNVWNGYFNMPGWNYEDFFFQEMMPQAEKKYNCRSDKYHRAIMGLSMGGGGSVVYCQHHPDMFSSCYAMSAWLDNDSKIIDDKGKKDKLYYVCRAVHENSALAFLDKADDRTKESLRNIKWFIDCGDDDFLLTLSYEFYMKMKAAGIKSEFRVRNGIHNWEYWHGAVRLALPFASRNFEK